MFDLDSTPQKEILQARTVLKGVMLQQKILLRKKILYPFKYIFTSISLDYPYQKNNGLGISLIAVNIKFFVSARHAPALYSKRALMT